MEALLLPVLLRDPKCPGTPSQCSGRCSGCGLWTLLALEVTGWLREDNLPQISVPREPSPFLTFLNGYMATSSLRAASSQGISCCQVISSNTNWMGSPKGSLLSMTFPSSSWITVGIEGPVDSSSICRTSWVGSCTQPSPGSSVLQDRIQIQNNTVQLLMKIWLDLPSPGAALYQ